MALQQYFVAQGRVNQQAHLMAPMAFSHLVSARNRIRVDIAQKPTQSKPQSALASVNPERHPKKPSAAALCISDDGGNSGRSKKRIWLPVARLDERVEWAEPAAEAAAAKAEFKLLLSMEYKFGSISSLSYH
jgi:hypothetical protein